MFDYIDSSAAVAAADVVVDDDINAADFVEAFVDGEKDLVDVDDDE